MIRTHKTVHFPPRVSVRSGRMTEPSMRTSRGRRMGASSASCNGVVGVCICAVREVPRAAQMEHLDCIVGQPHPPNEVQQRFRDHRHHPPQSQGSAANPRSKFNQFRSSCNEDHPGEKRPHRQLWTVESSPTSPATCNKCGVQEAMEEIPGHCRGTPAPVGEGERQEVSLLLRVSGARKKLKLIPSQRDPKMTADMSEAGRHEMDQAMTDCNSQGTGESTSSTDATPQSPKQ